MIDICFENGNKAIDLYDLLLTEFKDGQISLPCLVKVLKAELYNRTKGKYCLGDDEVLNSIGYRMTGRSMRGMSDYVNESIHPAFQTTEQAEKIKKQKEEAEARRMKTLKEEGFDTYEEYLKHRDADWDAMRKASEKRKAKRLAAKAKMETK